MSKTRIRGALRQLIVADSRNLCAYCHSWLTITGARPVIDHIIPEVASGMTVRENLCLICHSCNEFKGAQVTAYDPLTQAEVPLFLPRQQVWQHILAGMKMVVSLIGTTAIGRATVKALRLNHPDSVEARRCWVSVGWHPPQEDL